MQANFFEEILVVIVGVGFVGQDDRAFGQVQLQLFEYRIVGLRTRYQGELYRLTRSRKHQMYPQAVEVAPLTAYVAAKRSSVFLWGINPAAPDADVVAYGYWQRVNHMRLFGIVVVALEGLGQQREQSLPQRRIDGVQAAVEVALANHGGHVAILFEEETGLLEVGAEEGGDHQSYSHNFGGGQVGLGIVLMAEGLQELVAQIVDGGYGNVDGVLPVREGFRRPSNREDIDYHHRGQLRLGKWALVLSCLRTQRDTNEGYRVNLAEDKGRLPPIGITSTT